MASQNHGRLGYIVKRSKSLKIDLFLKARSSVARIGFGLLATLGFLSGCRDPIASNLNESEVTRLAAKLETKGISAQREKQPDGRWSVTVASNDATEALRFIDSHRLMRRDSMVGGEKASMLASREEQRFHFERAMSREIETTLSALDGVYDARVHLNLPPLDPLFGQTTNSGKGSASVLLVVGEGFLEKSNEIGSLVSGASGIPADTVSVLFSRIVSDDQLQVGDVTQISSASKTEDSTPSHYYKELLAQHSHMVMIALVFLGAGIIAIQKARRMKRDTQGFIGLLQKTTEAVSS